MTQLQLTIVEGIASKVDRLLQRVEGVKRGSDIGRPTTFNHAGQQHAEQVATRDARNATAKALGDVSTDANTAGQ